MNIQAGQLKDLQKVLPTVTAEQCTVLVEGGNDTGETFKGTFLVEVKQSTRGKKTYKIEDGQLLKTLT